MGIPLFNSIGELPPGEHEATLSEIEAAFGSRNECRKVLFSGLRSATSNLKESGVRRVYINGSFITSKEEPADIDGCWECSEGVDLEKLDPVFLSTSRKPMREKFGVEFFISAVTEAGSGLPFPQFFQMNHEGEPKGILFIKIGGDS